MTKDSSITVRVSDAIARALRENDIDIVFGICGGFLLPLLRAFERAGIQCVPSRHEGAAAFAAAAYAQATGRVGVVFGQGPGATNTLTGVAAAYADSTPLLVIASQAPQETYGRDAHQEATGSNMGPDQLAMFRPITRAALRPQTADTAVRCVRRALTIARAERGPVMIEIPTNLLKLDTEFEQLTADAYSPVPQRVDVAGIEQAAQMIAEAARPVLILGNRVNHRGLGDELRGLCEDNDLPFALVDFAKGLIAEDHPLHLGVVGWAGHVAPHVYLQAADLVVTLGMRMDTKSTFYYRREFYPNLLQIDEVAGEIGRNFPCKLGVLGDLPATVRALRAALARRRSSRPAAAMVDELRRVHRTYDEPLVHDVSPERISSAVAMHTLRKLLPRDTVFVGDSGMNLHYLKRFVPMFATDSFFCLYGWAAMGAGLPVAIGVQVARPSDVVVLVIGDGGLLTHAGELQVLAERRLPVIVVCLNNAGYGQVGEYMERYLDSTYSCEIEEIDAARIAQGFGCDGVSVRTPGELQSAVAAAVEHRRPIVIDVKVQGDRLEDVLLPAVDQFADKLLR